MKNNLLPSPLFWAVSRRGGSLLGWVSHFKHYGQENSSLRLITDPIKLATKINHLVNRVAPAVPGGQRECYAEKMCESLREQCLDSTLPPGLGVPPSCFSTSVLPLEISLTMLLFPALVHLKTDTVISSLCVTKYTEVTLWVFI